MLISVMLHVHHPVSVFHACQQMSILDTAHKPFNQVFFLPAMTLAIIAVFIFDPYNYKYHMDLCIEPC